LPQAIFPERLSSRTYQACFTTAERFSFISFYKLLSLNGFYSDSVDELFVRDVTIVVLVERVVHTGELLGGHEGTKLGGHLLKFKLV
jgi:hypothetical protein